MAKIEKRVAELEKALGTDGDMVAIRGIGFFYGDETDVRYISRQEYKKRPIRGLADFYKDIAEKERSAKPSDESR